MFDKLESVEKRYNELNELLSDPKVIAQQSEFQKYAREHSELSDIVSEFKTLKKIQRELSENQKIQEEEQDEELLAMAQEEIERLKKAQAESEQRLKALLLPTDPRDNKNVIMEIRAGTGGEEAALFCANLFRMYCRYAE
ncbi:MAG: PCRF domain-containing protein, partial [Nitrospinales bacterium]